MILMATLGPKASALVDAGRSALRGTDTDLERVEAALRARLGAAVLPPEAAAPPTPLRFTWHLVAPLMGVFAMGGALLFALRPGSERKPAPAQAPSAVAARALALTPAAPPGNALASAEPPAVIAAVAAPTVASRAATASSPTARRGQDQLVREVALLSQATSALRGGRTAEALKVLDEHQREFPNGILSEERRGAKAQALCSLGRLSEGRAELAPLSSQSPVARRAKQVCDAAATSADKTNPG